jgi:ribosomal protein S18 acetylase RimI-like enzyme
MSGVGLFGWRPIGREDAADWAVLLAAIEAADRTDEHFSEQDLLEDFSDPDRDFERGSVAVYDGTAMVGYGAVTCRSAADPVHEMWQQGGVHPNYRSRGIGSRLLDWAERAAVPLHRERYPGRPLTLSGACISGNDGAVALYAAHGYRQARWFHGMTRDLATPLPEVPGPAGVDIVGFTPERSPDARLVSNEAFRDHWGSTDDTVEQWAHFTGLGAFRPALSFLAYAGQEPLGIIMSQEYDAYTEATGIRDLHIPLIGTRRMGRKRGIASALLFRALAEASAAGFTTASLGVDADSPTGALGLYKRAGFTVRDTWIAQLKPVLAAEPADPR